MSDKLLRELERRFRNSGSAKDEEAYLREKIRKGLLTEKQLKLAAYLKHEVSISILGNKMRQHQSIYKWIEGLGRQDENLVWRSVQAVIIEVRTHFRHENAYRQWMQLVLDEIDAFLLSHPHPTDKHPLSHSHHFLEKFGSCAYDCVVRKYFRLFTEAGSTRKAERIHRAVEIIDIVCRALLQKNLMRIGSPSNRLLTGRLELHSNVGLAGMDIHGLHEIVLIIEHAIQNEVVPFVLGYSDPVRERVEARQREQTGTS